MQANTEVGTNHEHADVESQTQASAYCEFLEEILEFEFATLSIFVILEQPDVARIKEYCSLENAEDGETQLPVGLELKVTYLVIVGY